MKVINENKKPEVFNPIIIVIESGDEALALGGLMNSCDSFSMKSYDKFREAVQKRGIDPSRW